MAPVRIGVVGVGTFGINHLRCFQQMGYMGQAELVAACDVNKELVQQRAQEFGIQAYTDHREMLAKEQLDGITVVTPDPFHHDIVMAAAEAGVHVLCEKPLDVTTEGCREMIQACDQAGVLLMVDFHKRYDEYHLAMREKIQAGDLGQIQYGYAHMEDRIEVPRDWFPGWATKSSPAWFLGVHFYDLACFLLGAKGVRVWATGQKSRLREFGVDTWDSISAKVTFDNGATVAFDTSWIIPEGFEATVNQGIRLVGTLGFLECDSQDRGTRTACTNDQPVQQTHNKSFLRMKKDKQGREIWEGYGIDSIADFALNVNELLAGKSLGDLGPYPSGEDGLEATRIAAGVHQSLETGEIIELAKL
ncbi:MAG: Gfo/Idh/MocA family oxidoreductase [candidate division WS1 bacterium]|nr:Gfo/Idh/MocA family oxidoreductase [candidate division WS1 bacterium]